ncbi:TonB-dependent receptor domain-containing protein [Aurantiacibacter rhizosphaerae]|nr:TonB-dependent receptor [Aurantiacibacter rhizosphaerae]
MTREKLGFRANRLAVGAVTSVSLMGLAVPTLAQDNVAATSDNQGTPIVVTGSRIARDGTNAPTPVTMVGDELLEQRAATNVADTLNELPLFRPLVTPATQQAVGGNVGASVLDLRGLGGERTLVLLDGKRFVPSTQRGTVDINLIPTALVSRTEIVTGGASAAYGSDAVAGVVNFILDRDFVGLRGTAQFGIAEEGDNEEYFGSLAWGTDFADGRGHFMIAGEYNKNEGMGDCYTRDWCPNEMQLPGGGPGYATTVRGGPAQLGWWGPDGLVSGGPAGGPFQGTTFNPDGSLRQFQYGESLAGGVTSILNLGGEDSLYNGLLTDTLLIPEVERYTIYAHASYELSDTINASLDASYGRVNGLVKGSPPRAAYTIQRDNAFLPDGLADLMDANDVGSVSLWRVYQQEGPFPDGHGNAVDETQNETFRIVAGLEGSIGTNWDWDAYYQYGNNDFRQDYRNNYVNSRGVLAVDAVNTADGVQCRVNTDGNAANDVPGCVPLNPFGRGNVSSAAADWVFADGFQTAETDQHVVAANIRGDLLELPGGTLAIAGGGEFRSDSMTGDADALSAANAFWSFNGKAIEGKIEVVEGYLEAVAPIIADVPGVSLLELNGAIRQTHYSRSSQAVGDSSVDATTWKLGGIYAPVDWLRFRVTRSRDIRAPNLTELFGPVTLGRTTVVDPRDGSQIQINGFQGANPQLAPEKADTWTIGAVFTPDISFGRRLSFSVDYFDISIDDAIGSLGAQTIVDLCNGGNDALCAQVTRNSDGLLTEVQDVLLNIAQQDTRGIDFELAYSSNDGPMGSVDARLLATHYLELTVGGVDRVGQTGARPGTTPGVPDWLVDGTVRWNLDRLTAGLHAQYIPESIWETLFVGPSQPGFDIDAPNSVNDNTIDSAFVLDFNLAYQVTDEVEVFGVINNVFDSDPPYAASAQGATTQVYYDPIGRYYKVGVRIRLP